MDVLNSCTSSVSRSLARDDYSATELARIFGDMEIGHCRSSAARSLSAPARYARMLAQDGNAVLDVRQAHEARLPSARALEAAHITIHRLPRRKRRPRQVSSGPTAVIFHPPPPTGITSPPKP